MKTRILEWFAVFAVITSILSIRSTAGPQHEFRTDINPALLYFQAFQIAQLGEADAKYLFDEWSGGSWPDQPFDERRLTLLKQYDHAFKLLGRARFSQARCDWGYDLTDGPEAILPGLAPAKRLAQATRLRTMVALDEHRFDDLRADYAGALTLARNLSRDHILISCLVQIAMENILTSVLMENFYRFSPDQLEQLVAVFENAPKRGTIAETIGITEREAFFGYILRKVSALASEANGNEEVFWSRFEGFWNPIATEVEPPSGPDPSADEIKQAARGSSTEVLRLLNEMPALYEETARVMELPYARFMQDSTALFTRIEDSPNPFVRQFFTVFKNIRGKEFSAMVRQEMVRAAAAYERGGKQALEAVMDPLIGGSFEYSRVQFEGVDRGFRLRSKAKFRDFDEVMIFLEKPGKHFRLDGKNAGSAR
jgi:hypothetical protein